jgi:N-methylhydantoinase B
VTNTPWIATGHLNDITLAKPIFRQGRIVAFAASTAHAPDIGGKVRSVEPREVFEEGFHIPVMKFMNEGKPDQTLLKLLRAAVRTPDQTEGDLWAQLTGLDLLEQRLADLMTEYGLDDLNAFAVEILGRCERAMRAAIAALPDGTYTHQFQTDGLEEPFTFRIAITVNGERVLVDYAGTSPQVDRAINCTMTYTFAMTAYGLKCALLPNLPNNEGIFRCIEVTAPEGSRSTRAFPPRSAGAWRLAIIYPSRCLGRSRPCFPIASSRPQVPRCGA